MEFQPVGHVNVYLPKYVQKKGDWSLPNELHSFIMTYFYTGSKSITCGTK